jgi:NTP pyrophosphatase (non-canonical NTP hydrolase)
MGNEISLAKGDKEMIDRKDRRMCMTAAWDEVIQFNERYFPGWRRTSEVFYSNALAGEVGEVCNMTKHRAGGGTNRSKPSAYELMDEIADVFIYLELLVEIMGLDVSSLSDAIHTKVQINIKRMKESNPK